MFGECRDEGEMGKTAGETSTSKPGREKSVEDEGNKQVESRKVSRGGLGVTVHSVITLGTVLLPRALYLW